MTGLGSGIRNRSAAKGNVVRALIALTITAVMVLSLMPVATAAEAPPVFDLKWRMYSESMGIAVDASGNVYLADYGYDRIEKFDSSGNFITQWGSHGSGPGEFNGAFAIAVDGSGNVYVTSRWDSRVEKFDSSGNFITQWGSPGSGPGQFYYIVNGIAVDGSGNVYVADSGNSRIEKFDSSGNFITQWGSSQEPSGWFFPFGLAADASGDVYAADTYNHQIQKFDSSGNFITEWGSTATGDGQLQNPYFVAVDGTGNVYVSDTGIVRVQKFDSSGNYLTQWGSFGSETSPGDGNYYYSYPYGLAVDGSGNVYLADTGSGGRVLKYKPAGPGPTAHVSLSPLAATDPVGTTHTVTATLSDANGNPTPGTSVQFRVSGSVSTSGFCTADAAGTCSFSYTGPDLPGADAIVGWADLDGDGLRGDAEPYGEATKAWTQPATTPGQVTGGGQIPNSRGVKDIAFGFNAKSDSSGVKGNCNVVDISPVTNIKINCTTLTGLVVSGTHATIFATGTINGTPTTIRIDVDDLAEPGRGYDTFKVSTSTGYTPSGTLLGGNVQIHQ